MTHKPYAADFDCFVNGKIMRWNDNFGLRCRWMAANEAKSATQAELQRAADVATQRIREQLSNQTVLVLPKPDCKTPDE